MAETNVTETLRRLVDGVLSDDAPKILARSVIGGANNVPSANWSFNNRILMLLGGTEDARGYRQWEEVGRHVKRGAKAIYILAPLTRKIERDGQERHVIYGFRTIPVFRFEDTEGAPLPEPEDAPITTPPLFDVAEKLGVRVTYAPYDGAEYGFFRPATKSIVLKSTDVPVFFHELAHAAHHLEHDLTQNVSRIHAELVAEFTAAVLSEIYGYAEWRGTHIDYLRQWANADPNGAVKAITAALIETKQTIDAILALAHEPASQLA